MRGRSRRRWWLPRLRRGSSIGEVYDDPSEDALYMFMEDLKSPGSFFRIDRLEEGREGEWAHVALSEIGLYQFESSEHIRYVSSLKTIHEFLTRWAFDLPSVEDE